MKLLKKNVLDIEITSQRKRQVDEGMSLATKIDSLRLTLADEESKLLRFRESAIKAVQEEINALVIQKTGLLYEIDSLKDKITELEISLQPDTNISDVIWAKLSIKSDELDAKRLKIISDDLERSSKNSELEKKQKTIDDAENALKKEILESERDREEAGRILESAEKYKEDIENTLANRIQESLDREATIAVRERELSLEKESVEQEKENITNQRILLIDRERTLERELKRNNG